MKILAIDFDYYYYPQGIDSLREFIDFATERYNSFIELTQFQTDNCSYPYFIKEDTRQIFVNVANINMISEYEVTVLSRAEYNARLERIISEKCVDCENYGGECVLGGTKGLEGGRLSLDGECWSYEKREDAE